MRKLSIGIVLALAAGQGAPPREVALDAERALARLVDPARAQVRVRELVALGPRMGGTRAGDAAAEFLAARFRELGLDVRVTSDPLRRAWQPSSWKLSAQRVDSEEPALELTRAWPWQNSPGSSGTAELALASRAGAAWLTDKPARGASDAALLLADGSTTSDGAWPMPHALRAGAKQACFGIARGEGATLRGWLAAGATVQVTWTLASETREAPPKTVVARLPGRAGGEPWKAEYFLFCAHGDSDSGGPGADDNASGAATVLEIATAWKQAIDAKLVPAPAREVRFAIWGSEIFSTDAYVERAVPSEGGLLGVINYDQAGFGSGANQVNVEPDDVPANAALVHTLVAVMRDHAPKAAGAPGEFPAHWATNMSLGGTDSYCFSKSSYCRDNARPALTVFSSAWGSPAEHPRTSGMPGESWRERDQVSVDYDVYYHSAGDRPENTTDLEPWNMAWCARVGMLGAARYLESLK